ncbi:unnamed protein product [Triticum turgidum subsp. durum]|uniref:non-specific serine/threonine protein kinase n=1 Tax=Triticum turgidum subsp. durum TaxID=4567 RepID=A0A9R1NK48_TRITD|nr:unnamed protein product [Triticum turgidum subsp. durum]
MPSASSAVPPAAAPGDESQSQKVLLGRYELGGLLGRGASAKVYRARDLLTGRDVAIKSFPNPRAGGRDGEGSAGTAAIEREAAILARLRHRHVVRLHEILGTRKKVHFVLDLAGYLPFNDASLINMYRKIYAGRFRCPYWFSPALRHLLRRILDPNPATRIDTDGILEHPWFRHGASGDGELENLMRGHEEEAWFKTEFKEDMARDMTAFDILAFSPGSDLSGLFVAGPGTERVFVGEPAAAVLARVEDAGKKQGYGVRREGKGRAGPVYVEAEAGGIVAKVTVFRIADAVSVVEVVKGHGAEAAAFWSDWLEPAVKPQAV